MTRRRKDQGPDLFAWADAQLLEQPAPRESEEVSEPAEIDAGPAVIDFLERRPSLPRWILGGRRELIAFDLWYGRKTGEIPPAPILPLKRPPSTAAPPPQARGAPRPSHPPISA